MARRAKAQLRTNSRWRAAGFSAAPAGIAGGVACGSRQTSGDAHSSRRKPTEKMGGAGGRGYGVGNCGGNTDHTLQRWPRSFERAKGGGGAENFGGGAECCGG